MLKEMGRSKKNRRHKTCKCSGCKSLIDIDEKLELQDYDKISENTIVIYCDKCGNEELIKL